MRRSSSSRTPTSTPRCKIWAATKYRNAGQVCVAPTRFLVQKPVYRAIRRQVRRRREGAEGRRRHRPDDPHGAAGHSRRIDAFEGSSPTPRSGAEVKTGGRPHRQQGLSSSSPRSDRCAEGRAHHERGAVRAARHDHALRARFDGVVSEANRLPYGLAAYAFTKSAKTAERASATAIESGMVSINSRPCAAGSAVRRRQGFRLRHGRWPGGDRRLSQHQIRDAGRSLSVWASIETRVPARRSGIGKRSLFAAKCPDPDPSEFISGSADGWSRPSQSRRGRMRAWPESGLP